MNSSDAKPRLTPAQFFLVNYLFGLGRMTKHVECRHDPRTVASLIRLGWLCVDGEKMGLTEKGLIAYERRQWGL